MRRPSRLRRRPSTPERGSAAVELVLIAPALVLIVLLLVAGGRLAMAGTAVESAAAAAARDASLAESPAEARELAAVTAEVSLENSGVRCAVLTVTIEAGDLDAALGVRGSTSASVHCTVDLADVALPGLGGQRTLMATATSPIDPYRERG